MAIPNISVLYPLRNASEYPNFERGIQSTLDQVGVDVEIIVGVDPNSTDGTWNIISGWAHSEPRIKPFSRDPAFVFGDTLDACAERATGRYFIIQTARVRYGGQTLFNFRRALQRNPLFGFVYGKATTPSGHLPTGPFNKAYAYQRFITLLGYMYRADAWRKCGLRYAVAEYADDGSWIGLGDRDFQMQMMMLLGWDGYYEAVGQMYYDGPGELTARLQANRSTADRWWRERWGGYFGDVD